MTQMLNVTHQTPTVGPVPGSRTRPLVRRSLIITLAAGALISSAYSPAFAEPGVVSDVANTQANVVVNSIITLTGLDPTFTLTGLPGETVNTDATGPINYTVTTNNLAGYVVTVQSQSDLLPQDPNNSDFIPISALSAGDNTAGLQPLSVTSPVIVHNATTKTADVGDLLTTNFSVDIPFVNSDTYTATLDYVATTL